uniref:Putative secreted protein n=1 Tax=Ixodes ricinus TaxID=34613 RepID=A0A6B0UTQ5_IXORI
MCFLLSDLLACRTCLARLSAFVLRNVAACLDYDCQMPKDFQKGAYLTQGIQPIQLLNSLELSAYRHTSYTPRKASQTSFQPTQVSATSQVASQAKASSGANVVCYRIVFSWLGSSISELFYTDFKTAIMCLLLRFRLNIVN